MGGASNFNTVGVNDLNRDHTLFSVFSV
jgi:hypothetical protein